MYSISFSKLNRFSFSGLCESVVVDLPAMQVVLFILALHLCSFYLVSHCTAPATDTLRETAVQLLICHRPLNQKLSWTQRTVLSP